MSLTATLLLGESVTLPRGKKRTHLMDARRVQAGGQAVVFKDGNKQHVALDNLELVSRAELMRRNTCHRYGKEIAAVVQLKGAITRQINRRNRNANDQ